MLKYVAMHDYEAVDATLDAETQRGKETPRKAEVDKTLTKAPVVPVLTCHEHSKKGQDAVRSARVP